MLRYICLFRLMSMTKIVFIEIETPNNTKWFWKGQQTLHSNCGFVQKQEEFQRNMQMMKALTRAKQAPTRRWCGVQEVARQWAGGKQSYGCNSMHNFRLLVYILLLLSLGLSLLRCSLRILFRLSFVVCLLFLPLRPCPSPSFSFRIGNVGLHRHGLSSPSTHLMHEHRIGNRPCQEHILRLVNVSNPGTLVAILVTNQRYWYTVPQLDAYAWNNQWALCRPCWFHYYFMQSTILVTKANKQPWTPSIASQTSPLLGPVEFGTSHKVYFCFRSSVGKNSMHGDLRVFVASALTETRQWTRTIDCSFVFNLTHWLQNFFSPCRGKHIGKKREEK